MTKKAYSFRIKPDLRDKLLEEAVAEHRSATNMLEWILEDRYKPKEPDVDPAQPQIEED